MTKEKFYKNIKNFIYIVIISSFLVIYFSSKAGYFDEIKSRRVELTKEQISKFEEDVLLGKEIDVSDYYGEIENKYNNKVSELGHFLSSKIENLASSLLDKIFKALNDFLNS